MELMEKPIKKITGGIYLVVDPSKGVEIILPILRQAIAGGVNVVQIWDHWLPEQAKEPLIEEICGQAHAHGIPVLINEDWRLLLHTSLDGVHFDNEPDMAVIRKQVARPFIAGITCGNEPARVNWAIDQHMDYISFCSMFPSGSAATCELVSVETVQRARQLTGMPIFLAGGITPENISSLAVTQLDGIAVIGGIMKSADPQQSASNYKQALQELKQYQHATRITQ